VQSDEKQDQHPGEDALEIQDGVEGGEENEGEGDGNENGQSAKPWDTTIVYIPVVGKYQQVVFFGDFYNGWNGEERKQKGKSHG